MWRLIVAWLFMWCLLLTVVFGVVWGVRDYRYAVEVRQYLRLADDASLPALKKDFLLIYKDAVTEAVRREEARYIFKQSRLTKAAQMQSLESLIIRLADLERLSPDSLAYQQGMSQISGQEFDHVIDTIDSVFADCYMREHLSRYLVADICVWAGILTVVFGVIWFCLKVVA